MQVICSYCKNEMGEKEPFDDKGISHTVCKDCFDYFKRQLDGISIDEYLGLFEAPIMIVNEDGRIVAINDQAETMTGKSREEVFGLFGGDMMECAYARLPEGCGNTVHCVTCSIRNAVMATMDSGKPQINVPVKLQQKDNELSMTISTENIGSLVRIKVKNVP